jgi:hypothetical protein
LVQNFEISEVGFEMLFIRMAVLLNGQLKTGRAE